MNRIFKPKLYSLLKAGITRKQVQSDILAGLVVGIVALPLSIAFAIASGVSPEKGIVTAIIAGFLISLLGGSRVQIGGPTGAFIIVISAIVGKYGLDGLMISTILAGVILVLFGLLRLGTLLKYFPQPLVVGFTSGIAIVIFSTQIRDALGLNIAKVPSEFIAKWGLYFRNLDTLSVPAVIITGITIVMIILARRLKMRIPGSFLAILILTPIVHLAHIPVTTIESFFGSISGTFHISLPLAGLSHIGTYFAPAMTIAMLGSIESLLSAVVSDGMISGNHRSNTELIAQGLANIASPLFGGLPATGAIARTATNVKNGGRTPIAGIVHALTLLLIMLFFGRYAKLIPMSLLAGILIVVAYDMSEWRSFLSIFKSSAFDIIVLLVSFFLTVLVDLTAAIEVGVVLSALLFMKRMADISMKEFDGIDSDVIDDYSTLPPRTSVYEISGPLFFASARRYAEVIKEIGFRSSFLIIRMRHVPFIDLTGMNNFRDVIRILEESDVHVLLSGVSDSLMKTFESHDLFRILDSSQIFDSFETALAHAAELTDKTAPGASA